MREHNSNFSMNSLAVRTLVSKVVEMMRICMLTSGHRADASRLVNEARSLAISGWQVVIMSPNVCDAADLPYYETYRISGRSTALGRLRRFWGLLWLGYRNNPEVYHVHELDTLLVALILARLRDSSVVYDCHEYHAEAVTEKRFGNPSLRRLAKRAVEMAERRMSRASDLVVAVNDHLRRKFEASGCKAIALPNYPLLSETMVAYPSSNIAGRYENAQVMIYVGKLSPQRGITTAISAVARLIPSHPDLRLLLVGRPFSKAYGLELEEMIRDLGLTRVVEITGQIPHKDVSSYLAIADIGLFLLQPVSERYNWGEPIKLFEYAAAGIAMIISDLPAKRRLVEGMECGLLVDPMALTGIVNAISSLLANPQLREDMGERGRAAFLEMYNWQNIEGRLILAYREMMGEI